MKKLKTILLLILFLTINRNIFAMPTLVVGIDDLPWPPFTNIQNEIISGVHYDLSVKAFEELGIKVKWLPLPFARLIYEAKKGNIDIIVSASFTDERTNFFHYPPTVNDRSTTPWKISNATYVLITRIGLNYNFTGDLSTIPAPARTPRGYSVAQDLRKKVKVEESYSNLQNMKKMIRDRSGSVVVIKALAKSYEKGAFRGRIKVHKIPVSIKTYYLPVSKQSKLTKEERLIIWKKIVELRERPGYLKKLFLKYSQ